MDRAARRRQARAVRKGYPYDLQLSGETWDVIIATPGMQAKVLEAAETGGLPAVNALLAPYGVQAEG